MSTTDDFVKFSDGENYLVGKWSIPPTPGGKLPPLIVLATGDGRQGSKGQTWSNFVRLFNAEGFATFLFDFTGLGYSPGVYENLTLTLGCKNFRGVMKYISTVNDYDKDRIGVVGSSYGGNVALLEGADFPQIKAFGLKSASTFLPEGYERQYGSDFMRDWGIEGYSSEVGHHYTAVTDSLFHNTYLQASKILSPVRVVNGTADTAVPIRHARDLLRVLQNGTIFEVEGADHWYAEGDEWQRMGTNIVAFMKDVLDR